MNRLQYYVFVIFAACAVASCGNSHDHAHDHDHAQEHTHENHSHDHAHEEHLHEHEHEHSVAGNEEKHVDDAHSHSHPEGCVTFSLEQQKKIDFAVDVAQSSSFNGAVKVAARVAPAPANLTTVVATETGRISYIGGVAEGKSVGSGEPLFSINGGNVTDNDAAVKFARAESDYQLALADYERKSLLYKENVASLKELQTAEAALHRAEAHYNSMKRSFNGGKVVLDAPIAGYVSSLPVENGEYVSAGTVVAHIQREGEVYIEAELPVRFSSMLSEISDANIELNDGRVFSLSDVQGRIVAVGRSANSCNMIPVTIAAKKLDAAIPGSIVTLHLISSLPAGVAKIVIPRTALVEEMGNFFVFVQHCDDAFEKREVKIGATDGLLVQILKGLHEGERLVSKGAVSLKLSQSAGALDPHAGHVH